MKNRSQKIKNIFIKKMLLSTIVLLFVSGLLVLLGKSYLNHNQINTISDDLLVKDQYTLDKIGSYQLLNSKYAMELELHNLGDMRKLDSVIFSPMLDDKIQKYDCAILDTVNFKLCKSDNSYLGVSVISINNNILGYVLTQKKYNSVSSIPISYDFLLISLTIFGMFAFNVWFIFLPIKRKIEKNTKLLLGFISANHTDKTIPDIEIEEYKAIAEKFSEEHFEVIRLQKEKTSYEERKNISEQVAHDIRSPLSAINTALLDVSSIPENRRIMIKNAARRINDIANNLLLQTKNTFVSSDDVDANVKSDSELIFVILDAIVSEKRFEYAKTNVQINLNVSNASYNCFSIIDSASFKRVLSNLINNAVEATSFSGAIIVSLACDEKNVKIDIEDNGCGISESILPEVTKKGFSYRKKNGAGFGLSYAKKYVEQVGGTFSIHSEVNVGTKVTINLARAKPSSWFCESIKVNKNPIIMILDDDPSIHDTWNDRLRHIADASVAHFSTVAEFEQRKVDNSKSVLYLIDYELYGSNQDGLDVIEGFNISENSILVTSCFEDMTVRARCEKLGVKIIPKLYVPYIPIIDNCVVLIDDDELIREVWVLAAKKASINVLTYEEPGAFYQDIHKLNKNIPIYIDSHLGRDVKGEVYAKELYDQGFCNIYLCTGYQANKFANMPWIKSIVGKEPPFG